MSDAPAIIERDDSGWFERLCAEKGLVAAKPKLARDLTDSDVLFDVTGVPKPIEAVKVHKHVVVVTFESGPPTRWHLDVLVTLIATKGAS